MADQIVSWGGIVSKGTSGLGVTGSFSVSGSSNFSPNIAITGSATIDGIGSSEGFLEINSSQNDQNSALYFYENPNGLARNYASIIRYVGNGNTLRYLTKSGTETEYLRQSAVNSTFKQSVYVGDLQLLGSSGDSPFDVYATPAGNGMVGTLRRSGTGDVMMGFHQWGSTAYAIGAISGNNGFGFFNGRYSTAAGTEVARFSGNNNLLIGTTTDSARLTIKGSGTTSSTTALLVQNANASASFTVRDDGLVQLPGGGKLDFNNSSTQCWITTAGGGTGLSSRSLNLPGTGGPSHWAFYNTSAYGIQLIDSSGDSLTLSPGQSSSNFAIMSLLKSAASNRGGGGFIWRDNTSGNRTFSFGNSVSEFGDETGVHTKIQAGAGGTVGGGPYGNGGHIYLEGGAAAYSTNRPGNILISTNITGSKVGIGISIPTASLHISGSSNSVLLEIDSPAVNNILYVSGSGNVGIGTGSPSTLLNLKQVNSSTSILRLDSSTSVGSNTYEVGVDFYSRITGAGGTDSSPVGKIYGTGGSEFRSGKLRFQTIITNGGSLTDTITLYQGNVGIGSLNTLPSTLLQVTGLKDTIVADFSSNTVGLNEGVSIQLSATAGAYPLGVIKGIFTNYGGYSDLTFSTSTLNTPTEAMRINSSQQVGIGTTSPTAKLQVKGSGTTSSTTALLVQNSAATENFRIYDNGNITIGLGTTTFSSIGSNGNAPSSSIYFDNYPSAHQVHHQIITRTQGQGNPYNYLQFPTAYSGTYGFIGAGAGVTLALTNSGSTAFMNYNHNGITTNASNTPITIDPSARTLTYGGGSNDVNHLAPYQVILKGNRPLSSGLDSGGDVYILGGLPRSGSSGASGSIYLSGGTINISGSVAITGSLTVSGSDITSAWSSYTPVWTTDSTQPVLNNGTLTGAYKVIGKTCFVRVKLNPGSTTTFGTGAFQFSLPFSASVPDGIQFPCSILNNGLAWYQGTVNGTYSGATNKSAIIVQSTGGVNSSEAVTATHPFTFGTSDSIQFNGSYEIA